MLTISDEAEGLLNRIFRHAFIFRHVFHYHEVWGCHEVRAYHLVMCGLWSQTGLNYAKLRFHSARRPVSKHKTLFRLSILPKKMTLPLRIKYNMPCISVISSGRIVSTTVSTSLKVYISDFVGTPHSKKLKKKPYRQQNRSMFSHDNLECNQLNNAFLKLDLNPIHPAFSTSIPFHPRSTHDSGPHDISTLISWVSADISTASPFCKAGIFVSSSWVLHRMMCPMRPWARNRLGSNILGSQGLNLFKFQLTPLHMKQTR